MTRLWLLVHLAGVSGFLIVHGVQIWMLFAVKPTFPDRPRMLDRAETSRRATTPMYASIGVMLVGGIGGGLAGDWFSRGWWIWAAIGTLLVVMGLMASMASPYMRAIREATTTWADGTYPLSDDDLKKLLGRPTPVLVTVIGTVGLAVILVLMVYKPGA